MPRVRKPQGTPSPQRTDRNDAAVQAADAGPQDTHGQRAALSQSMEQMPLPDAQSQWQQALAGATGMEAPAGALNRPSEQPGQPVTAGMASGPGPGPETLAATRASPDAIKMLRYLPTLTAQASLPTATAAFRNAVRLLRAQTPS